MRQLSKEAQEIIDQVLDYIDSQPKEPQPYRCVEVVSPAEYERKTGKKIPPLPPEMQRPGLFSSLKF